MLCITQLVRRGRLVIMKFVNAYRREHRIKDRELACGESSDHDAPRAEALGAADAAGEEALEVVVRRVEGVVVDSTFHSHVSSVSATKLRPVG